MTRDKGKQKEKHQRLKAASAERRTSPPQRTLTKLDAIRHLLHASIRLFIMEEDPFVVHMVVQSCDKLINDYAKAKSLPSLNIEALLVPENAEEFWFIHRESYNFFKHADMDADEEL